MMQKYQSVIFIIGGILTVAGAATHITGWVLSPYIYTAGAIMVTVIQFIDGYHGDSFIIKRLRKQQIFGALLLLLTSLFMFTTRHNEWIVCLSIAAVLELYTAFRIPQEMEKEKNR